MYHDSDNTWKPIFDDWFKIIKEIRSLETPLNPREGQLWINNDGNIANVTYKNSI